MNQKRHRATTARVAAPQLCWSTGAIVYTLLLLGGFSLIFGIAAVNPELAEDLGSAPAADLIALTAKGSVFGVNIPLLLLATYMAWETFRFGWRWADEVAIKATDWGLVPHGSTFIKPLAWTEIDDVRLVPIMRASALRLKMRDGSERFIRGLDNRDGAAERFAAFAQQSIAR